MAMQRGHLPRCIRNSYQDPDITLVLASPTGRENFAAMKRFVLENRACGLKG
jgi:hypothetical protein